MRVAMLSKALVVGSYQRKCELIAESADIDLVTYVPKTWGAQHLERAHMAGYHLVELPIARSGNFHLHAYPTLGRRLRTDAPAVFHVDEEPYNLATVQAFRAGAAAGARLIFFSWQNLRRRYPPPFSLFERYVFRRSAAAIAGNEDAKRVLLTKGCACPIYVIPQFGVDEERFAPLPRPARAPGEPFVVGFAGRLVREKGVDVLVDAVAGLTDARLVLAGSGDQEAALLERAAALGMRDRVSVRNARSVDMPGIYAGLDVLVLPSRSQSNWKEQFGRVLIEAMACGVPVVGSTCGEIPNVIGDAGLIFAEEDAGALRAVLARLQSDAAEARALAERGRRRVLERYTMRAVARATVEIYRAVTRD